MFFCQVETAEATNQEHNRQPFNIKAPEGLHWWGRSSIGTRLEGVKLSNRLVPALINRTDSSLTANQSKQFQVIEGGAAGQPTLFFTRPNIIFCI
jgi:hypothetical protein